MKLLSREESASHDYGDELYDLLWNRFDLLLSGLIDNWIKEDIIIVFYLLHISCVYVYMSYVCLILY